MRGLRTITHYSGDWASIRGSLGLSKSSHTRRVSAQKASSGKKSTGFNRILRLCDEVVMAGAACSSTGLHLHTRQRSVQTCRDVKSMPSQTGAPLVPLLAHNAACFCPVRTLPVSCRWQEPTQLPLQHIATRPHLEGHSFRAPIRQEKTSFQHGS